MKLIYSYEKLVEQEKFFRLLQLKSLVFSLSSKADMYLDVQILEGS